MREGAKHGVDVVEEEMVMRVGGNPAGLDPPGPGACPFCSVGAHGRVRNPQP